MDLEAKKQPEAYLQHISKKKLIKWIVVIFILLSIVVTVPWIGMFIGLGFIGIAGGVLAKKAPRSFIALIEKTPVDDKSRIRKFAVLDIALGLLVLYISFSTISADLEKKAARNTQIKKAAEEEKLRTEAEKKELKHLRNMMSIAVTNANKALSAIDESLSKNDYEGANATLIKTISMLKPYLASRDASAEVKTVSKTLDERMKSVSRKLSEKQKDEQEKIDVQLFADGKERLAAKDYQQAVAVLQRISENFSERRTVDSLLAKYVVEGGFVTENAVFWRNESLVEFNCKEPWWALFNEDVPGKDEFERRDARKEKPKLAKELKEKTFYRKISVGLGEYDFKKHRFPLEASSNYDDCKGYPLSLTRATAVDTLRRPGDKRVGQYSWQAKDFINYINVPEKDAQAFSERHNSSGIFSKAKIKGRVAFKVQPRFHKEIVRAWAASGGYDLEDSGAGRLLEARIVGIQIQSLVDNEYLVDRVYK
jgi:hypothetical protein